ncbi:hypothetical protein N7472_004349 [Penicillium cf. griseofulvum]|uniref:Uncharacterized protein n=1 Tax=Penicillium cf. griseofulvum TaxID=2972120 RepID=A0A9W9JLI1_9EURO|nr:hypothetical protein N7472_004349 [Penicillium cf. griseofulvum]
MNEESAVPNIVQSDVELPPGRWAEYAISLPWDTARRSTRIRTDLLAILRGHELQRGCSLEYTTRALAASAAFFQSSPEVLNRPQVRRALRERTRPLAAANQNLEVVLRNPASIIQEIYAAIENQKGEVNQFLASFQ